MISFKNLICSLASVCYENCGSAKLLINKASVSCKEVKTNQANIYVIWLNNICKLAKIKACWQEYRHKTNFVKHEN